MKYTVEQKRMAVADSFKSYKMRLAKRMNVDPNSFKIKDGFVIFKSKMNQK